MLAKKFIHTFSTNVGKAAYLEDWVTKITVVAAWDADFNVTFEWNESTGDPGAFIMKNQHHSQFYLKTITSEDFRGHGRVRFLWNSWVCAAKRQKHKHVFFANKVLFPAWLRNNEKPHYISTSSYMISIVCQLLLWLLALTKKKDYSLWNCHTIQSVLSNLQS